MGQLYLQYLEGSNLFLCVKCGLHLTHYHQLISKGFRGKTGKAYLFAKV